MVVKRGGRRTVGGRGPIGSFSPISLSPALWLDATEGVYTDAGTTLATNGQTVQQWNDKSGNARHFSQGTAASRPTFSATGINTKPGVDFDGTDDRVFIVDAPVFTLTGGSFSAVLAIYPESFAAQMYAFGQNDRGASKRSWIVGLNATTGQPFIIASGDGIAATALNSPTSGTLNALNVIVAVYDHPNQALRISLNGGAYSSTAHTANIFDADVAVTLGCGLNSGAGEFFVNGLIAGAILFKGTALTQEQAALMYSYFVTRWP